MFGVALTNEMETAITVVSWATMSQTASPRDIEKCTRENIQEKMSSSQARKRTSLSIVQCADKVMEKSVSNKNETLWIADSGSTIHVVNNKTGMRNIRKVDGRESVQVADGDTTDIKEIGDYHGISVNTQNEVVDVIIKDVCIVPSFKVNLFSITKGMGNGCELSNDGRDTICKKTKQKTNLRCLSWNIKEGTSLE